MAAPKADINKATWEDTDISSVCERCLGPNPYVLMTRERHADECKICTRPFTVFRWRPEGQGERMKKTIICLTCARQKNCCQSCMLDLSFGVPLAIRDAALRMVQDAGLASQVLPGSMALTTNEPVNVISKQFVAQNIEARIREDGEDALLYANGQDRAEEIGKALLQQLAVAQPYHSRSNVEKFADGRGDRSQPRGSSSSTAISSSSSNRGIAKLVSKLSSTSSLGQPLTVPKDTKIMSLFLTGVEDDLPEHALRTFFAAYGTLKSVVCSHRSHCAFINYTTREAAEAAAAATGTTVLIAGCPLRVTWGRPRAIGDEDHSLQNTKLARANKRKIVNEARAALRTQEKDGDVDPSAKKAKASSSSVTAVPKLPPGQASVTYASQRPDFEA
ncbi:uncharacterized protein V1518DRAFT_185127 [Limtongia smithiae]|uniref:uncharacterized protein n=1 Tax=Limtongia smithiae TaxID=1125753 RepID=UPI0034CFE5D4